VRIRHCAMCAIVDRETPGRIPPGRRGDDACDLSRPSVAAITTSPPPPFTGTKVASYVAVSDRRPPYSIHEARIRGEVLDYLRQHPHAMDSLDGIATWWLPRHEVRIGVELVARALETLEDEGLLERVGDTERPLFRLRPSRVEGADGTDSFNGRS